MIPPTLAYQQSMGIPRFTSFVNRTFKGWKREEIKGKLIIDGHNTYHNLYRSFDWSHGGQFPEFQEKVRFFFTSLKRSGIIPIVVMDGTYETRKLGRLMTRMKMVSTIFLEQLQVRSYRRGMYHEYTPPLAINVFITAMIKLEISFVVVDGEGDEWIYKLANRYCCPVLSNDSDFMMYKLEKGYVPFNRFHWEASPINAEVYHYRAFCEQNKFQDPSLRLAIPAIAGTDYIARILGDLDRDMFNSTLLTMIQDLQLFRTLEDYISQVESIPGDLSKDQRKLLKSNCLRAQEMYDLDEVTTLEEMNETAFNSKLVPDWLWRQFRMGHLSPSILEILVTRSNILNIFVDNIVSGRDSCVLKSLPIRKCVYGIIGSGHVTITEHYRKKFIIEGKIKNIIIPENITSKESINGLPLPHLINIPMLSMKKRKHLFYSILGCDDIRSAIERLDDYWHFVMAVTVFWARHTNASSRRVKALILSFVVCSGYECKEELPQMHTEFFLPDKLSRSRTSMLVLHSFAQWQSTYTDSLSLNELLMLPLKTASPADLYDGKLAMFFAFNKFDFLRSKIFVERIFDKKLFEKLLDKKFFPQLQDQQKPDDADDLTHQEEIDILLSKYQIPDDTEDFTHQEEIDVSNYVLSFELMGDFERVWSKSGKPFKCKDQRYSRRRGRKLRNTSRKSEREIYRSSKQEKYLQ